MDKQSLDASLAAAKNYQVPGDNRALGQKDFFELNEVWGQIKEKEITLNPKAQRTFYGRDVAQAFGLGTFLSGATYLAMGTAVSLANPASFALVAAMGALGFLSVGGVAQANNQKKSLEQYEIEVVEPKIHLLRLLNDMDRLTPAQKREYEKMKGDKASLLGQRRWLVNRHLLDEAYVRAKDDKEKLLGGEINDLHDQLTKVQQDFNAQRFNAKRLLKQLTERINENNRIINVLEKDIEDADNEVGIVKGENIRLKEERRGLGGEIDDLKGDNLWLKHEVDRRGNVIARGVLAGHKKEMEKIDAEKEVEVVKGKNKKLKNERRDLGREVDDLKGDNLRLKRKVDRKGNAIARSVLAKHEKEMNKVNAEKELNDEILKLEGKIEALEIDNLNLNKEIDEQADAFGDDIIVFHGKVMKNKDVIKALNEEVDGNNLIIFKLNEDIETANESRDLAVTGEKEKQDVIDRLERNNSLLNEAKDGFEKIISGMNRRGEELRLEVDELMTEVENKTNSEIDIGIKLKRMEEVVAQSEDLHRVHRAELEKLKLKLEEEDNAHFVDIEGLHNEIEAEKTNTKEQMEEIIKIKENNRALSQELIKIKEEYVARMSDSERIRFELDKGLQDAEHLLEELKQPLQGGEGDLTMLMQFVQNELGIHDLTFDELKKAVQHGIEHLEEEKNNLEASATKLDLLDKGLEQSYDSLTNEHNSLTSEKVSGSGFSARRNEFDEIIQGLDEIENDYERRLEEAAKRYKDLEFKYQEMMGQKKNTPHKSPGKSIRFDILGHKIVTGFRVNKTPKALGSEDVGKDDEVKALEVRAAMLRAELNDAESQLQTVKSKADQRRPRSGSNQPLLQSDDSDEEGS